MGGDHGAAVSGGRSVSVRSTAIVPRGCRYHFGVMAYSHTQRGPLWIILAAFAVATGVAAVGLRSSEPAAAALVGCLAVLFGLLAACFATLRVCDAGEHLDIRFGPLPLFGTRVPYAAMRSATPDRSTLIDGWGIHYFPGRGWTYNLWGWSCVLVERVGRDGRAAESIRIGTDDAEGLAEFLRGRLGAGTK